MFITFNTKSQVLNYIKRRKDLNYSHNEGCGCCYSYGNLFLDRNKLIQFDLVSSHGNISASATVIGKIKNAR